MGWKEEFDFFQRCNLAKVTYDQPTIEDCETYAAKNSKSPLQQIFNISSYNDLDHLWQATRAGIYPSAPSYLPEKNNQDILLSVLRHVDPAIIARARALTP